MLKLFWKQGSFSIAKKVKYIPMKKISATFLMLMFAMQLFAQEQGSSLSDSLYASGKIYVVVTCVVVILFGLLLFLFSIEKRLKKLEKKSSAKN